MLVAPAKIRGDAAIDEFAVCVGDLHGSEHRVAGGPAPGLWPNSAPNARRIRSAIRGSDRRKRV